MLDELEALGGLRRRVAADVAEVGQDRRRATRRPRGGGWPRCRRSRSGPRRGSAIATVSSAARRAAAGSAATASPARSNSSTNRSARSSGATAKRAPRLARPSLIRHSGVLISRIDDSSRPCRSTRSASFQACSRWWPGIGLVGDRRRQPRGAHRQVGVDVDPRAASAVEPVVGAPRLAGHERHPQVLAVRQPERLGRRRPEPPDQPVDDGRQALDRDLEALVPGRQPRVQRALPGEQLVEPRRGRVELGVGPASRREREAALDMLEIRQAHRRPAPRPASRGRPAGPRATRAGRARARSSRGGSAGRRRRRAAGRAIGAAPCRPGP